MLARFQVQALADTAFVRDAYVNTLYFDATQFGPGDKTDWDALCNDLAVIFATNWYAAPREVTVKAYEIGPPPNFPIGEAVTNLGMFPASPGPRELALCLSFFGGRNLPRQRGRIYLAAFAGGASALIRPNAIIMDKALALAQNFADLGGIDVAWNVWSPTSQQQFGVTDAWVDNEWDVQRSRGFKPTDRVTSQPGS